MCFTQILTVPSAGIYSNLNLFQHLYCVLPRCRIPRLIEKQPTCSHTHTHSSRGPEATTTETVMQAAVQNGESHLSLLLLPLQAYADIIYCRHLFQFSLFQLDIFSNLSTFTAHRVCLCLTNLLRYAHAQCIIYSIVLVIAFDQSCVRPVRIIEPPTAI